MINKPLISVIMPTYNSEIDLSKCLESVISQSYTNLEIIAVDGGSEDNTRLILSKYANLDKRLRIFLSDKGPSHQRNVGTLIAKGQYIFFIDSDDYIDIKCIELLLEKLIVTKCDVVSTNIVRLLCNKNQNKICKCSCSTDIYDIGQYNIYNYIERINLAAPFKLFKSDFAKNVKFNEKLFYGEDLFYMIYLANYKTYRYCICEESLYFYKVKNKKIYSYNTRVFNYFEEINNQFNKESDPLIKSQIYLFYYRALLQNTKEFIKKDIFFSFRILKYRKTLIKSNKFGKKRALFFLVFPLLYCVCSIINRSCRTIAKRCLKVFLRAKHNKT